MVVLRGRKIRPILFGRDSYLSRWLAVIAVISTIPISGILMLSLYDIAELGGVGIIGYWIVVSLWMILAPMVAAYRNDGILVSILLATSTPFSVGFTSAISPGLTGVLDPLPAAEFGATLALTIGVPVGAAGYLVSVGIRTGSRRVLDSEAGQRDDTESAPILLGAISLLTSTVVSAVVSPVTRSGPGRIFAVVGVILAVLGLVVGFTMIRNERA